MDIVSQHVLGDASPRRRLYWYEHLPHVRLLPCEHHGDLPGECEQRALDGNTTGRNALAAGSPLFATQMYSNLGVHWATSLLGFLAIAMTPFPVVFFLYGKKIRGLSKSAY